MPATEETSTTKHNVDRRGTAESAAPLRVVGDTGYPLETHGRATMMIR